MVILLVRVLVKHNNLLYVILWHLLIGGSRRIQVGIMSTYQDIELNIKTFIDADFEIDDNGNCYVVSLVYTTDEDDPVESKVELEAVVDSLIDHLDDVGGYQDLFSIAHEFSRQAERLRDAASRYEDIRDGIEPQKHTISLFGVDDPDFITDWGPDADD